MFIFYCLYDLHCRFRAPTASMPERHIMLTCQFTQLANRRLQQLGVSREGDVLGLHGGVHGDPGQIAVAKDVPLRNDDQRVRALRLLEVVSEIDAEVSPGAVRLADRPVLVVAELRRPELLPRLDLRSDHRALEHELSSERGWDRSD